MNIKIDTEIRESITHVLGRGIKLRPGAWLEFDATGAVVSCDPLIAVLVKNSLIPEGIHTDAMKLATPGFIKGICIKLNVDPGWIVRFCHGWDRNHHMNIVRKDKDTETVSKDEVSAYAITLRKEFMSKD